MAWHWGAAAAERNQKFERFSLRFFGRQFHFALWRASHDRRQRVEIINKLSTKRCKSSLYQTSQTTASGEAETHIELTKLTLSDRSTWSVQESFRYFHDDFLYVLSHQQRNRTHFSLHPSSPINRFYVLLPEQNRVFNAWSDALSSHLSSHLFSSFNCWKNSRLMTLSISKLSFQSM